MDSDRRAHDSLKRQGLSSGMAEAMASSKEHHPMRFWLIDNSFSMNCKDGKRFLEEETGQVTETSCSRWEELQHTLLYHSDLVGTLGVPSVFRLLNRPRGWGPNAQEFRVPQIGSENVGIDVLNARSFIMANSPWGFTPLVARINELYTRINECREQLAVDQKAVVVIATDGEPSDGGCCSSRRSFVEAIRRLQTLPVWIVIRLCTDEDHVVDFYNDLDRELALPVEVIDDFMGEAKEVHKCNPWLNYGLPLHRCREAGIDIPALDRLDESMLSKAELLQFLGFLFGKATARFHFEEAPDDANDWDSFASKVAKLVAEEDQMIWNPITKEKNGWINMDSLLACYQHQFFGKRETSSTLRQRK